MTPVIALSLLVAVPLVAGEVPGDRGFAACSGCRLPAWARGCCGVLLSIGALALRGDPHVSLGALGRVPMFDVGGVVAISGLIVGCWRLRWVETQWHWPGSSPAHAKRALYGPSKAFAQKRHG